MCSARLDAGMLKRRPTALSDQILLVRRLRNAKPPTNPKELDLQVQLFNRAVINATGALETMRKGVKSDEYRRDGCTQRDFAKVRCLIAGLTGVWRDVSKVKQLWQGLLNDLAPLRGQFANVSCSTL